LVLRQPRPKITLSLTPLIDVVFILLIFFMLASQFADWRTIDLVPQAQMSGTVSDEKTSSLQLLNDGSFILDGEAVAELQTAIEQLIFKGKHHVVFLTPEEAIEIQHVIDVIEALNTVGLAKVQLSEAQSEGAP
jgi:biopolymer transport protein ExbD